MAVQRVQQVWQAPRLAQMALDKLEPAEQLELEAQALRALDMSEPVAGLAA